MATTAVPTTDILQITPYIDPDAQSYGEVPSASELEFRVAATPAGSGALITRRQSVNQIALNERTGRQLDALQTTTNTTPDTNVTAATYSATNPSGYSGNSLEIQATGGSSTDRGCRKTCSVGASDLSVFGGGAMLRFHRRCTSVTNLLRWVARFEFASATDYAEFEVFAAAEAINTWAEVVIAKGNPRATNGTVNWALWTGVVRWLADVSGAYTGNLEVRDLRIGTTRTAKTTPDGHLAYESSYDVRRRYRDDATAKATSTTAAAMAAGATVVKYTAGTYAAGDELTVITAGFVETRTISNVGTSGGGTGLTVSEAFTYAHGSGDTIEVRYWGPWSAWLPEKPSQPPTAAASTPADAATVTDPTLSLVHTFSSPSSKAQASRVYRVFLRVASVDQLIREVTVLGTGLTDTLPRFLLGQGGDTFAWEKTAYDTDGLSSTTARRSFTTSFSTPAAVTGLVATPDPANGSVVLAWDASVDGNFDHFRVYRIDDNGNRVRIDGGPESLDDGRTPLAGPTFTDYGADLGDNQYQVSQHNGALESDPVFVVGTLTTVDLGRWTRVEEEDGSRYTFEMRVIRAVIVPGALVDSFAPPGRGGTVHIKWGSVGQSYQITVQLRPAVDGDLASILKELLDALRPGWWKAPAGWVLSTIWGTVRSVTNNLGVGGMMTVDLVVEETERA